MKRRRVVVFLALLGGAASAAGAPGSGESVPFETWTPWIPRPANAPLLGGSPDAQLLVDGDGNRAVLGGWEGLASGIRAGTWYRLSVRYRATGQTHEMRQVVCRIDWRTSDGRRAGQPEYGWRTEKAGEWTRVITEAPAPKEASRAAVQLLLWDAPAAKVWWDEIRLEPIPAPAERRVRIAAVNLYPRNSPSAGASLERFIEVVDRWIGRDDTDLIVLPEGITVAGTGKNYAEVAGPVPGPVTERLGAVARAHHSYLAAGVYEQDGAALYNTAVLLDRFGRLAGKYRKVYIPREETEGGISPGNDYPVFETDFGRVGLLICWDIQYADPARALTLRGAEILLLPIWGGNEVLARARAIENQVFLVSSGYDFPTQVMAPDGEILSMSREQGTVVRATIDLNRRYADPWLGDMRARLRKELRLDVPVLPEAAWR